MPAGGKLAPTNEQSKQIVWTYGCKVHTLQIMQGRSENEKTPIVVIKKIREAILDELFKPGDWLPELDLAAKFQVSRSPVREALLYLEREGTVITEPHKGARVRPLSEKETLDIAEVRLDLLTFAIKTAHRYLSSADFDLAYKLAKQITQSNSAKEQYEYNHRFWDIIFEASRRPVRREIFRQLDDRITRYYPLTLRLFPDPKTRPRQQEVLIESYRKGNVDAAIGAFKKAYLNVVHQIIDYLKA
jgi:GntR family transcriptional regulator, trigonelline degradation regulator